MPALKEPHCALFRYCQTPRLGPTGNRDNCISRGEAKDPRSPNRGEANDPRSPSRGEAKDLGSPSRGEANDPRSPRRGEANESRIRKEAVFA
jgi:hypothetical protein